MSILDGIKRAFNIGGCAISVQTAAHSFPQGGAVDGVVSLTGGEVDQTADVLVVELDEYWTETRSTGKSSRRVTVNQTRDSAILRRDLTILPGGELTLPFSLKLPNNSRLSTSSTGWKIKVTMDIPMAIDPGKTVVLNVRPAEAFRAIVKTCEERLGFTEKDNSWKWSKELTTSVRLLPMNILKEDFDYLEFKLTQSGPAHAVTGRIVFNLQEKSFTDYLKALLMMDRIEKPIRLTRSQLFHDDGSINGAEIEAVVRPMIEDIVNSRQQFSEAPTPKPVAKKPAPQQTAPKKTAPAPVKKTMKEIDPKMIDG